MTSPLAIHILDELVPGGFSYGTNLLIEFEPHSLWYETSLAMAAGALRDGVKTDYHTFQHIPDEIRRALTNLGLDINKMEREGLLRILDTYSVTTGLVVPGEPQRDKTPFEMQSAKLSDWSISVAHDIKSPHEIPEVDKRRLHIDDNTGVLLQYNKEKEMIDYWRTRFIPFSRARELLMIHSLVAGVYSEAFYRQFESICDGIIDFRGQERGEQIEHQIRIRMMRGRTYDSTWRRLRLLDSSQVTLAD